MDRAQSVLISSEATHDSDDSICEISHGIFARWPQHLLYAYFFQFSDWRQKDQAKILGESTNIVQNVRSEINKNNYRL